MRAIPRKHVIQYFVLALCAGIILKYFADRKDELGRIFNLQGNDLIVLALLGFFIHMLMGYKMFFILRKLGLKGMSPLPWLKVFTISRFLNFHLVQGGNVYRGVKLKQDYAFSYTDSLSMMAIFSWFEAVFILIISAVMVAVSDRGVSIAGVQALKVLVLLLVLFLCLPFVVEVILRRWRPRVAQKSWLHEKLTQLTDSMTAGIRDVQLLVTLFCLSLITFLVYIWQINTAFRAIGAPIGFSETAVFTAVTLLSGIINITPSNIGVTELMYGYLSSVMGKSMGSGIIVCGILRILGYLIVVVAMVLFGKSLGGGQAKQERKF